MDSSAAQAQAASAAATQLSNEETQADTLTNGSTSGIILYLNPPGTNQIVFTDPAPNFSSNEAVTFNQVAGGAIDGLTNGHTYYVIPVAGDPNTIELASTSGGPAKTLDPSSWLAGQTAGDTQTLDLVSSDPITGTLNLTMAPGSAIATGDAFVYHAAVGNGIQGLVDDMTYYAIVQANKMTLQVATSLANAKAGKAIALSATFTDASGNSLLIQTVDGQANTAGLYAPLISPLQTGEAVVYNANGASVPGLKDGNTYYVVNDQPGGINPINFTPSQVATGGDAITVPMHGFYAGEPVTYTVAAGGNPIGGLTPGDTYYAIVLDGDTIELASSPANAEASPPQALTLGETVASGNQTLTPPSAAGKPVTFSPSPVVDSVADTISLPSNGFVNGEAVTYTVSAGGTAIQGLKPGTIYYVISVDDNTIQLASTEANAQAGTPVYPSLNASGAIGTQTLTPVRGSSTEADFSTSAVSGSADAINLPNHGFTTGEAVTYTSTGTPINGLTADSSTLYYVIVVNSNTIRLADSQADALAGNPLVIDPTVATGNQVFTPQAGGTAAVTAEPAVIGIPNTITVANHGYVNGEAVTYSTTGNPIGGLSNAAIYYVIVVNSNTIELAATAATAYAGPANAIAFDPMLAGGEQSLVPVQMPVMAASFNPSAVRGAGSTFTLANHGFVTGEAVTYTSTGSPIEGLVSGTIYYVIVVDSNTIRLAADQDDAYDGVALAVDPTGASGTQTLAPSQPVFQLAASSSDATASNPIVYSLNGPIVFGNVDNTVMSGTQHTLTATVAAGIDIKASLDSWDLPTSGSGLGGTPTLDLLSEGQLSPQTGNSIANVFGNHTSTTGIFSLFKGGGTPKTTTETNPVVTSISGADAHGHYASGTQTDTSIAGSVSAIITDFDVDAEVGSDAVLKSYTNVAVESTISEKEQTFVEATVSKPAVHGSGQDASGTSVAVALEVGVFVATASALVDPNATIDAAGLLAVNSSTTYPFAFPFLDPTDTNVTETLGYEPIAALTGPFLSGNLGLQSYLVNNYTATSSGSAGGQPQNKLGIALSLAVNVYDNSAVATIGSGAKINQNPAYQTPTQSVAIGADDHRRREHYRDVRSGSVTGRLRRLPAPWGGPSRQGPDSRKPGERLRRALLPARQQLRRQRPRRLGPHHGRHHHGDRRDRQRGPGARRRLGHAQRYGRRQ